MFDKHDLDIILLPYVFASQRVVWVARQRYGSEFSGALCGRWLIGDVKCVSQHHFDCRCTPFFYWHHHPTRILTACVRQWSSKYEPYQVVLYVFGCLAAPRDKSKHWNQRETMWYPTCCCQLYINTAEHTSNRKHVITNECASFQDVLLLYHPACPHDYELRCLPRIILLFLTNRA